MKLFRSLALIVSLVFPFTAIAQSTNASILGLVDDQQKAVIAGAKITAINTQTGAMTSTTTDGRGMYVLQALMPGDYRVEVDRQGFKGIIEPGILLHVQDALQLNFSMVIGSVTETVTVASGGELINTTSAEISSVVNEASVKELPLNGRDPSSLVFLSTGVSNVLQAASTAGDQQVGTSIPTETGASAGGGRQGSTYYLLDGVPNMDFYELLDAPFPNADATQEFRVTSNNYGVEYGFSPSAVVNVQTKSGSNSFHGGAFEFIRNNDLNASNYFTHLVDPLKRNQFGGYIGGPVVRNKLFFFANYQATRASQGSSSNVSYTPTAAMLSGDFSSVPGTLGAPFATIGGKPNQMNPALFSKTALAVAANLPLGTVPSTGYVNVVNPVTHYSYNENMDRLDYAVTNSHHLTLRSFIYKYDAASAQVPGNFLTFIGGASGHYENELLNYTWSINPSMVNTFSGFWSRLDTDTNGGVKTANGSPFCLNLVTSGISGVPGKCYMYVQYVIGAFLTVTRTPYAEHRVTFGPTDVLMKTLRKHVISTGINAYHQFAHLNSSYPQYPLVLFAGTYTGSGLADFLLGDVYEYLQGGGSASAQTGWQLGLFAQDQFRIKPNLSITAGIRWEPTLPPAIAGEQGASFVPGQQSQRYPNAPAGLVFIGDQGVKPGLMSSDYKIIEPRVGIAWQPTALPGTSIRAGFGLFESPLQYSTYGALGNIQPFSPIFTFFGSPKSPVSYDNPWANYSPTGNKSPFPPFSSPGYNPPSTASFTSQPAVSIINSNMHLGTTQSWNASIERVLPWKMVTELAYVGSESYALSTPLDLNPGVYSAGGARTTYPAFGYIYSLQPIGTASYNSFQGSIKRAASNGLQFQTSFTWSKSIDTNSQGSSSWVSTVGDPYDMRHNQGNSDLNRPIVSVTNLIYQTPSLNRYNRFVREALGTWESTLILTAESGAPFSIVGGAGNNNSLSGEGGDRADVTGQPYMLRQGGRSSWLNQYFNPAAFKTNAPGTFGNSGRNLFQAPPIVSADLGMYKNFKITERVGMQFRWELFNALNHPSFSTPNNNPSVPATFGKITAVGPIPPRVMQAALKLNF